MFACLGGVVREIEGGPTSNCAFACATGEGVRLLVVCGDGELTYTLDCVGGV